MHHRVAFRPSFLHSLVDHRPKMSASKIELKPTLRIAHVRGNTVFSDIIEVEPRVNRVSYDRIHTQIAKRRGKQGGFN